MGALDKAIPWAIHGFRLLQFFKSKDGTLATKYIFNSDQINIQDADVCGNKNAGLKYK